MLNETEKNTFRKAVDFQNGDKSGTLDCPYIDSVDDVVSTQDDLASFQKKAALREIKTDFGTLFVAEGVQAAPGKRRGDLFVMDFGHGRAAYFTGEGV